MKILISVVCLVFLGSFYSENKTVQVNSNGTEKVEEPLNKDDIFKYLEETREGLEESVEGLSDAQMQFKPDAEGWSVAEIVEHIIIVEGGLRSMLEAKFAEDPTPELKAEVKMTDEQILGFITDRSQKVKTQSQFEPSAKYATSEEALEAFNDQREDIVDFLKDTEVDMRNYINEFPFGKIDAYQTVLFMAGHTARHTQQIEEVKSSPGFPD
ncbi:DinB family protein [Christiangramia crocea]|uniref:DinB family protein n=1 Tax=Christiangramia crocea TaxID=2904124 RepID=A0A9X1UYP5_9FLAO|nr:DinB family protein [Gramella crocea]MCG9972401.1 DinB family protein [Gramella crocea]